MPLVTLAEQPFVFREARPADIPRVKALAALLGESQARLIEGCKYVVALDASDQVISYAAWRPGPEGWDIEVVAVGVRPDYQGLGIYRALNVWIVRDAHPDTTVCTYLDHPATEHVVLTQWRPHVVRECENGSKFYGTRVSQVIR